MSASPQQYTEPVASSPSPVNWSVASKCSLHLSLHPHCPARQTQTVRGTSDGRAEGMRIVKQQQEEEQHMEFTALMKKHALRCAESTEEA